jgi:hypothetical protein
MLLFVLFATELLFKEEVTSFDAFSSSSHTETSPPCDAKHLNPFFFFVVFFVVIVAFSLFFLFLSFEEIIVVETIIILLLAPPLPPPQVRFLAAALAVAEE